MGYLGSAHEYLARVEDTMTGTPIYELPWSSLSWQRVINDASSARVVAANDMHGKTMCPYPIPVNLVLLRLPLLHYPIPVDLVLLHLPLLHYPIPTNTVTPTVTPSESSYSAYIFAEPQTSGDDTTL